MVVARVYSEANTRLSCLHVKSLGQASCCADDMSIVMQIEKLQSTPVVVGIVSNRCCKLEGTCMIRKMRVR